MTKSFKFLFVIASLVPAVIFFVVWAHFAVNIPFQDDIDAILEPTTVYAKGVDSLSSFWNILSTQDDERRIVMVRLVSCIVYSLFGQLDFRLIALAGLLSYLIFLYLIFKWFRGEKQISLLYFLPVPYLLFTQENYGAIYQSMVPLQHIGVYVWAFASIWFLVRPTRLDLVLAIGFGVLSVYSDVTGTLIVYIGIFILLLQKKYLHILVWVLILGPIVYFYFQDLTVPDFRPTFKQNIQEWDNILKIIVAMPGMMADIFTFLPVPQRLTISFVTGIISLLLVAFAFFHIIHKQYFKKGAATRNQIWLLGCVLFLFITFLAFAVGRSSFGVESTLLNRYKHMFTFWAIFNYLIILYFPWFSTRARSLSCLMLVSSVLFFLSSYFRVWGEIDFFRKTIQADAYGWSINREFPSAPIYLSIKKSVDVILEDASNHNVYDFPELPSAKLINGSVYKEVRATLTSGEFINVSIEDFRPGMRLNDGMYLIMHSSQEVHIVPMKTNRRSFLTFLTTGDYLYGHTESSGFLRQYLTKNIQYQIKLGVIHGDSRYLIATRQKIQN